MVNLLKPDKEQLEEPALGKKQVLKYAEDLSQTYKALQDSERRYRTLWSIGKSLHKYINMDDLTLHIMNKIKESMKAEVVSIMLYNDGFDEWLFYRADDPSGPIKKQKESRFPESHSTAESVFRSGKPQIYPKVSGEQSHKKMMEGFTLLDGKSIIAVPLQTKEKVFGVLEVMNEKNELFDDKDLFFLTTLSPIVAMALDNAKMYTELEREYKELKITDRMKDNLIKHTEAENFRLRQAIEERYRLDQIIGYSDQMLEVFRLCEKVMESDITVLVEGETGTGKELIAQCIHHNSQRKEKLFVTQNCAGIPDTLLASELFGHKRGAFTGAVSDKKGLFEIAHGGTIFLDEVAEMSATMQISLLRVLQEGEIKPLGDDYSKNVDVRIISATNKDLDDYVRTGKFREDLLYRLNVFSIKLPPLRKRAGDIPILAKYFMEKFTKKANKAILGISLPALRCLEAYPFPGNVRELENEMERAVTMARNGDFIEPQHLSEKIHNQAALVFSVIDNKGSLKQMVASLERSILSETLKNHGGNKTKVAKALGLSRNGLMKKIKRYGL